MNFVEIAKSGSLEDWNAHLATGEDPNEWDTFGSNALAWILKLDRFDLFEHVIKKGSDPFAPYRNGGAFIFDLFSSNKSKWIETVLDTKEVWEKPQNRFVRDKEGNGIFQRLIQLGDEVYWEKAALQLKPEDYGIVNEEGRNLYLVAAAEGRLDWIANIELEALHDSKDSAGKNVLHLSAEGGYSEQIQKLLSLGFPLEDLDHEGFTALYLAVIADEIECIELLLSNGANLLLRNHSGESITRFMDRKKRMHALKVWKKELFKRFASIMEENETEARQNYINFLRLEKPLSSDEIAKLKLVDELM
ncbi:ankyrin repeat protein [Leptospira ryugenii]|uniref:Ankyrin repeat protein n=1 Tax=Leptospira ryugenii TaxID=1917863 RepID=A0A2P2E2F7_9LEPT|nr:ankyrin repeat domain-containing protein [Leptospira ryugenii]GBF51082.1 ankyrin repeat protein [Leptospira ryugenii]